MLAIALAAVAASAPPSGALNARDWWATINICDTSRHPDVLGLRAEAPGNGTRQRIFMRFTAQYYDDDLRRWRRVRDQGRSPFIDAGSARFRTRQAGYSFTFRSPTLRTRYRVRGKVDIEYRERRRDGRWRLERRLRRRTTANHRADGADPRGYSQGQCVIQVGEIGTA